LDRPLRIAFLHPDLGIGGAERLVVDAALSLQAAGHQVTVFTAHHDRRLCFTETADGTLAVRVYGRFLPLHVGQRLRAPCAIARMAYLACAVRLRDGYFDVIFCDLVSHAIPLLRLLGGRAQIVFYCHFPDQLLTPPRRWLYRLYRAPIDWLEELTTGMADRVLVNSRFTAQVFRRTFPRLRGLTPEVLYPGVDGMSGIPTETERDGTILCFSRYESRKNLGLALDAFALLRERLTTRAFAPLRLVVAGGYDERLRDNRQTLAELQARARQLGLGEHVVFLRSPSEAERTSLLSRSLCVVYTPQDEHLGYVPLEAMAAGCPVVAVASGGPLETIRDGETGLLCAPTPDSFADALARITNREEADRMGRAARAHVAEHFSRAAFARRLVKVVHELAARSTA
jgi:alpha-1,3/alpha-1,6-mannosyltransferase